LDELNRSLTTKLKRAEEDLLANFYKVRKHVDQVDFVKFKQDVRKESTKSNVITERILDDEERKFIDGLKDKIEKTKDMAVKLAIEFKNIDPNN
jgi:hypothetical protein